jgi:hypothetical protein
MILVEDANFKIAFNGKHFCVFRHRLSVYDVQYISIEGGCTIQYIGLETDYSTRPTAPSFPTHPIHRPPHVPHRPHHPHYPPVQICPPMYPSGGPGFVPPPPPPPYQPPGNFY